MIFRAELAQRGFLPAFVEQENQKDFNIITSKLDAIKERVALLDNHAADFQNAALKHLMQNQREQAIQKARIARLLKNMSARIQSQADALEQSLLGAQEVFEANEKEEFEKLMAMGEDLKEYYEAEANKEEYAEKTLLIAKNTMRLGELNNMVAAMNNVGISDEELMRELQQHSTPGGWK
ncbi:MAG: hypothetical protein EZS28_011056 [Streblomastix strix]|uniref:Uncharacterized protein n=1 Tax=Streblomastix strix TaxID=222440 RepID=A0A5J4WER3_9EUKA|nr:MAG: hypothetical protein EZS28_011056 [Streblomastix strix]